MAAIDQNLQQIREAVYGEEVRGSIVGAIEQCYADANDVVKVSENQPVEENVKLWVKPTSEEYKVPTWEEHLAVAEDVGSLKNAISALPISNTGDNIFRNASISSDGTITEDAPTRLLTDLFEAETGNTFSLSSNYGFRVCFYKNGSFTNITTWIREYTFSNTDTSTYDAYRINARNRMDSSAQITPDEVTYETTVTDLIAYMPVASQADVEKVQNNLDDTNDTITNIVSDGAFGVEQGAISGTDGTDTQISTRIRTGYLKFSEYPVTITAATGYEFRAFVYNEDFSFYTAPGTWRTTYTINEDDYYRRLVIKHGDALITPDEFATAISSGMSNAVCVIPSGYLFNRQINAEKRISDLEPDNFNLNIFSPGKEDEMWSYPISIYPSCMTLNRIRNHLYWGFCTNLGYSGIGCYDFDTGETTKTLLKKNDIDDHNACTIYVFDDGDITVSYAGGHDVNNNIYVRRALTPESIEKFDDAVVMDCGGPTSYGQMFYYNNILYLFYRVNHNSWYYRTSADKGATWSNQSKIIESDIKYYCKLQKTTTDGVLRVCMFGNQESTDPSTRMAFIHLSDMSVYDADNATLLASGGNAVTYTDVTQIIVPPQGSSQRFLDIAVTDIDRPLLLFCNMTNNGNSDGVYKYYDSGTIGIVAAAGESLWIWKYQNGCVWLNPSTIIVGRGEMGEDKIQIYYYDPTAENKITPGRTLYNEAKGNIPIRNARPIVDNNERVVMWHSGYYNSLSDTGYKEFNSDAKICIFGEGNTEDKIL